MKKILIPIAKTPEGYPIIEKAVELAKKFDSKITLLYVDNSKNLKSEINDRYSISESQNLNSLGDQGFVERRKSPEYTGEDFIKGNTKTYKKKSLEERYMEQEKANNTNFLRFVELLYQREGIKTDTILKDGDPASAIIDEAERGDYDLIIMKTHTMKERKRFMLGSVTNKVVHHIDKPILIIR